MLDSSGTADTEGNTVVVDSDADSSDAGSNPLHDLGWIFNELIQWVRSNIGLKWDVVRRKGRAKVRTISSHTVPIAFFPWENDSFNRIPISIPFFSASWNVYRLQTKSGFCLGRTLCIGKTFVHK